MSVVDGWVTASGRVRSPVDKMTARRALGKVPGVRGVTDEMTTVGRLPSSAIPTAEEPAR